MFQFFIKYKLLGVIFLLASCESKFAWHTISPFHPIGISNLSFLIDGYFYTISLSLISISVSIFIGLFLALASLSKNPIFNKTAPFYINFIRSLPLLALLLWVFYGLPIFLGVNLNPFISGVIALALSDSAFEAEIFRAGIQSVSRGQREAAQSVGLKSWYIYRLIIIPQAIRKILPAIGNQFVYMLKMSALVSIIGLTELTKKANELIVSTYRPLEIYTVLILEYFVLIILVSSMVKYLEKKMKTQDP